MAMKKLWNKIKDGFRWLLIALGIIVVRFTSCVKDEPEYMHDYSYIEHQVLDGINSYRMNMALSTLKINDDISKVCAEHSVYMASNLNVCHDNFAERANTLMTKFNSKTVGEVVAFGYSTAGGVVNGWVRSDSHRHILEKEHYTDFGISAYKNSAGRYYFTVIFTRQ